MFGFMVVLSENCYVNRIRLTLFQQIISLALTARENVPGFGFFKNDDDCHKTGMLFK